MGQFYQLTYLCCFVCRVGLVAAHAVVVGVIFGRIDVGVHLIAAVELELCLAGFKAPRGTIVALHCSAECQVRPVRYLAQRQHAQLGYLFNAPAGEGVFLGVARIRYTVQQLGEGLFGVVGPLRGVCPYVQFARAYAYGVGSFIIGRQFVPHLAGGVFPAQLNAHFLHMGEVALQLNRLWAGVHIGVFRGHQRQGSDARQQAC